METTTTFHGAVVTFPRRGEVTIRSSQGQSFFCARFTWRGKRAVLLARAGYVPSAIWGDIAGVGHLLEKRWRCCAKSDPGREAYDPARAYK